MRVYIDNFNNFSSKLKKELNNNTEMQTEFTDLFKLLKNNESSKSFVNNVFGGKSTFIQGGNSHTINITN